MIELDLDPGKKKLRQFGFIAFAALALISGWLFWKGRLFGVPIASARSVAVACLALGVVSALLSLVAPRANRPLFLALTLVSFPIGYVLSHVALGLVFYGVLTPIGLVFRIVGRDPLQRGFDPEAESYWTTSRKRRDKKSYFRQY